MPDTIERFLEVDEIMQEFLRMLQMLLPHRHQKPWNIQKKNTQSLCAVTFQISNAADGNRNIGDGGFVESHVKTCDPK